MTAPVLTVPDFAEVVASLPVETHCPDSGAALPTSGARCAWCASPAYSADGAREDAEAEANEQRCSVCDTRPGYSTPFLDSPLVETRRCDSTGLYVCATGDGSCATEHAGECRDCSCNRDAL